MSDLDSLVSELAGAFGVSSEPHSTASEHPRFSHLHKNRGKAEESQEKRRSEFLDRQKSARFDHLNHARKLAYNELADEDDLENDEQELPMDFSTSKERHRPNTGRYRNIYKNQLMQSEWLLDIPESLTSDWLMVPCPVGSRRLLVASQGVTTAYSASGYKSGQHPSNLPGGGPISRARGYTLVDCVLSQANRTYYVLDLLCWNELSVADSDAACRFFMLNSTISEHENLAQISHTNPYRFVTLPHCYCSPSEMEKLLKQQFEFELDGVLFFHKDGHYYHGRTPLVGWLKPFMLPEILNVPVPERYLQGHEGQSAKNFISDFNENTREGQRRTAEDKKREENPDDADGKNQ